MEIVSIMYGLFCYVNGGYYGNIYKTRKGETEIVFSEYKKAFLSF